MRVDRHNACRFCAAEARDLYFAAQQLVDRVDDDVEIVRRFPERFEALRRTVRTATPLVEAHYANQDHVLSPELASAREPVCPS